MIPDGQAESVAGRGSCSTAGSAPDSGDEGTAWSGALIGLGVGAVLVAALIWLPAALSGDFYEFTDPLVFMGLPIVIICVAAGALVGVAGSPATDNGSSALARGTSPAGRAAIAVVAVTAAAAAVAFFLFAIGAV